MLVSELAKDLPIRPLVRNVARVGGSVHEDCVILPENDSRLLAPLVIGVVIANEDFVRRQLHRRGFDGDRGTRG